LRSSGTSSAALGRAEASIAIDALLDIGTDITLTPGWAPRWVDSISLRSLAELPVFFGPAAAGAAADFRES
jgi:hypothetical protein